MIGSNLLIGGGALGLVISWYLDKQVGQLHGNKVALNTSSERCSCRVNAVNCMRGSPNMCRLLLFLRITMPQLKKVS